jgi:hypothetical protein
MNVLLSNKGFLEAQINSIKLPEDDPLTFACYLEWLYLNKNADTGQVYSQAIEAVSGRDEEAANKLEDNVNIHRSREGDRIDKDSKIAMKPTDIPQIYNFSLQFSCYVFGDKVQDDSFKNYIMQEINTTAPGRYKILSVDLIQYAYANTIDPDDGVRKVCIEAIFAGRTVFEVIKDPRVLKIMGLGEETNVDLLCDFKKALGGSAELTEYRIKVKEERLKDFEKLEADKVRLEAETQECVL